MNDIITLTSQSGEDIDFRHIADVKHRSYTYAILQPVILLEGMSANEALVFRVTYAGNGNNTYNIELNDKIVDAVFKKYNKQRCEELGIDTAALEAKGYVAIATE